ncbi:MAG: hypothetical protein L6408_09205 [Nanoarchaeota archaeon]|nr:hypothetical protein [Nanoarchaeota archaeon]
MKYKEVMVGRSETLPLEQFHSMKLYNQITVELCEKDNVQAVAEKLHGECKALLDEQKRKQDLPFTPASVKTENEFKTGDELLKEKNNDDDGKDDGNGDNNGGGDDSNRGPVNVEANGGNGGNGGSWDRRNRNLKQLLDEMSIRSVSHANFLRWNEQVSYREWQRLHDYFNGQEIQTMARQ